MRQISPNALPIGFPRNLRASAAGSPDLLGMARSRVFERLRRAIEFPEVILAAPAGYGKSTVLRSFLQTKSCAYRLVKIDAEADPLSLLKALAACLADVAPEIVSTFATVYDRVRDAPDVCELLGHWLAANVTPLQAFIVVDGVASDCDERVLALLSSIVDRTGGYLRWIVLTQSSAGFPIARWLAEDRMDLPVDVFDFAFEDADLCAAFGAGPELPICREWRELCSLTAGFPASIALALAGRVAVYELETAPREPAAMYAYLAAAVLSRLGRPLRDFIEQTCLFERFDAALLGCAGLVETQNVLAHLSAEAGLLTLDNTGFYEYDRRFRNFVGTQLFARADGAYECVAARSAAAHELDGSYAAAMSIHILCDNREALCVLLAAHGYELIDRGESAAVQRAFAILPHETLMAFPAALAVKASLESLHGNSDIAEAWFHVALDRTIDEVQRTEIVYRFAVDLVRRERVDAIAILQPIVKFIADDALLAAPLLALLAAAYATNRQLLEASRTIDRALKLLPRVQNRAMRAKIIYQAGFVAFHLRDIDAAKLFSAQAYELARESLAYDVAARALSVLYNIALDIEDNVTASRDYVDKLAHASARAGSRQLLLYATLCRFELAVQAGNVAEIELLEDRLASLEVFYSVLTTETLLPSQALQAGWSGDFSRAYGLLASSAEHQVTTERRAFRYAEIAVYAAAAGLRNEACAAAEIALTTVREMCSSEKGVLATRAYIALAFVLLRRHGRAGKLLRDLDTQCLHYPRISALVRVVRRLSERWTVSSSRSNFGALLETLDRLHMGGVARLIEALPLPERRDRVGPAIAPTCRKLGCHGRRHAVAVALTA